MLELDTFLITYSILMISTNLAAEAQHGLIRQVLKDVLFSRRPGAVSAEASDAQTEVGRLGKVVESAMGIAG